MADFCKQCSLRLFGEDFKELNGLRTEEMREKDTYPAVLCEGCGPTLVDEEGACVADDCMEKGHKPVTQNLRKCIQRRVNVFLQAFKDRGVPSLSDDDKLEYIDQFETSAEEFRNHPGLKEAYWYLRGVAEALDLTMTELFEEQRIKL